MSHIDSEKLGMLLVERGIISESDLVSTRRESIKKAERIDTIIIRSGLASEEDILPVISEMTGSDYVRISDMTIPEEVISEIPVKFTHHFNFVPLEHTNDTILIAINNPFDLEIIDEIKLALGMNVKALLAGQKDIRDALRRYYGIGADTVERIIGAGKTTLEIEGPSIQIEDITKTEDMAEDASIIQFVNQIFYEAYKDRATDIHIEPFEDELRIRYRIDGILYKASLPPSIEHFHAAIVSRIKIMANLDIAERRLPQDGRIKIKVDNDEVDLRISILPTPYGESVNIRILSTKNYLYDLENLGLSKNHLDIIESLLKKPHGIIFVTGPTGSGKTTTLYSCLNRLNIEDRKIITIEDPIEYLIKGISQLQINPKINFSFSTGLRSMLRHDPDIMMVGEVRDYETAEITVRVALTGHLVFSTLHTNDAASGITRLIDIGIEPYLVASSLECIIAQRLVRKICPHCKTKVKIKPALLKKINIPELKDTHEAYDGTGCEQCKYTGYLGRTGIYECLFIDDSVREKIMKTTPAHEIKNLAISKGMTTLRQDGWEKVKQGITSLSEIIRVTQDEENF